MNPNPENYCTLEMARRLQEAGIVHRRTNIAVGDRVYSDTENGYGFVVEIDADYACFVDDRDPDERLWSPHEGWIRLWSMAEAWRELPERTTIDGIFCEISFTKVGPFHVACYCWFYEAVSGLFKSTNPTDALCELLIWVKGEGR